MKTTIVVQRILLLVCLCFCSVCALADDYQVQVGDVIRISLPGEESLDRTFSVDRRGSIMLPESGSLHVSGVQESELLEHVRGALRDAFHSLESLSVYVAERRMLIRVMGYVKAPGEVIVAYDASIQTVLSEAGGLRSGAQLDRLQLRRDGQASLFNYKSYLDSGDPKLLPKLKSLDLLFIPASPKIGNVELEFDPAKMADAGDASDIKSAIKVFGEVNSPGSFTHLKSMSIVDLLMRAGGVTRYAGVERIRVINNGTPKVFDLKGYLDTGDESLLPKIGLGTTIFVPMKEEAVQSSASTVYIMGEVFSPGAYESAEHVSFMDILANAGGPTRYAESRQIRILKLDGSVVRFDLLAYTEGRAEAQLPAISAGDAIFVPEKTDMNEKSWLKVSPDRVVRVLGEVVRPGRIEWSEEMSFLDLLAHVGGPVSRADTSSIEVLVPEADGSTKVHIFDLDRFMREALPDSALPTLRPGSTVRVHDLPQDPSDNKAQWVRQSSKKSIYILGEVGAPGRYMFTDQMNFLDILSAADGPTSKADLHNIRITHRNKKYADVSKLNLARYFETGDESLIPTVLMGDTIYIPAITRAWVDKAKEDTIRVLGEVNSPGRYEFNDSMTILDMLAEAGGPTANAHVTKILVVNVSCCKSEARKFNLIKFGKTGRFDRLPVLRAGDTIYIPNRKDSGIAKFRNVLGDVFKLASLGLILGL